jgi:hypothetical protein
MQPGIAITSAAVQIFMKLFISGLMHLKFNLILTIIPTLDGDKHKIQLLVRLIIRLVAIGALTMIGLAN